MHGAPLPHARRQALSELFMMEGKTVARITHLGGCGYFDGSYKSGFYTLLCITTAGYLGD
jgi:hypothetical protein